MKRLLLLVPALLCAGALQAQITIRDQTTPAKVASNVFEWSELFDVQNGRRVEKTKPDADPGRPLSTMTPEEYCAWYYDVRKQYIEGIAARLKELPAKYDWDKLSFREKRSITLPYETAIRQLNADRTLRFPTKEFAGAKDEVLQLSNTSARVGDVFVPVKSGQWLPRTSRTIGNRTIVADDSYGDKLLLKGIAIGPFELPGSRIVATGIWHRIKDTEEDGVMMPTFEPWPFEAEAKKTWEKYLPEQDAKLAKAAKDAAKAEKDKKKKVETFLTPSSADKKTK